MDKKEEKGKNKKAKKPKKIRIKCCKKNKI